MLKHLQLFRLQNTRTAVVHAVESEGIHLAEVKVLSDDVVELWDFGGDGWTDFILVERKWPIVHDRLVVICSVLIGDVVVIVFVKVVFISCSERRTLGYYCCEWFIA